MKSRILILSILAFSLAGCINPFAPELGAPTQSLWSDASTIGGLLQNFKTAYELQDSLAYSQCLDEHFQFQYFDDELNRTESWYRETDLRVTAKLFRSFQHINLIWDQAPPGIEETSTPDSLVEFRIPFHLYLDEISPVAGFAHFTVNKPAGERFRIVLWMDDF